MNYRIIQTNRTSVLVPTHRVDQNGQAIMRRVEREPGYVLAEHNDPRTVRKHVEKIHRHHPGTEITVWPEIQGMGHWL